MFHKKIDRKKCGQDSKQATWPGDFEFDYYESSQGCETFYQHLKRILHHQTIVSHLVDILAYDSLMYNDHEVLISERNFLERVRKKI
jgi:hypothetical protein